MNPINFIFISTFDVLLQYKNRNNFASKLTKAMFAPKVNNCYSIIESSLLANSIISSFFANTSIHSEGIVS